LPILCDFVFFAPLVSEHQYLRTESTSFGLKTKADAQQIKGLCDGIIVGSALIEIIRENKSKELEMNVEKFVRSLHCIIANDRILH
jgi:tryptophan synthase alpha subunit